MFNEEDEGLNPQGIELLGDFVEVWKNLLKYDDQYGQKWERSGNHQTLKPYKPPFAQTKDYLQLKLFPVQVDLFTKYLLRRVV